LHLDIVAFKVVMDAFRTPRAVGLRIVLRQSLPHIGDSIIVRGLIAEVMQDDKSSVPYRVRFTDNKEAWVNLHHIQLLSGILSEPTASTVATVRMRAPKYCRETIWMERVGGVSAPTQPLREPVRCKDSIWMEDLTAVMNPITPSSKIIVAETGNHDGAVLPVGSLHAALRRFARHRFGKR